MLYLALFQPPKVRNLMRTQARSAWLAILGLAWLLLASLFGPKAWAAEVVAPFGQTVPTRTPTTAPVTPTATLVPGATATAISTPTTPAQATTSTPASPQLLPVAGGEGAVTGAIVLAGALFIAGMGVFRRVAGRNRRQRQLRD